MSYCKMHSEILREYYASYTVMLKILRYRGYRISKKYDRTREEFDEEYSEYTELSAMKTAMNENMTFEKGGPKIMVIWIHDKKLGANIRDVVSTMEENDTLKAFVIADNGPTSQVGETIKSLKITKKLCIDVWTLQSSMVFVPEHNLVPNHRICTPKERKKVYERYNLKRSEQKIPRLQLTDPMVKYLGATKNQLIEITRPSETDPSKNIISWRLVY